MAGEGQIYALLVGVNRYDSPEVPPLRYAVEDVFALREFMQQRLGLKKKRCLLFTYPPRAEASPASRSNVLGGFGDLSRLRMGEQDTFIFYFAGHGFELEEETHLLTYDSKPSPAGVLSETAISLARLKALLRGIRAGQQLIILEACRNAPRPLSRATGSLRWSEAMSRDILELVRDPSAAASPTARRARAILSSCWEGQLSYEYPQEKRGWFCHNLLEFLREQPQGVVQFTQHLAEDLGKRMNQNALIHYRAALDQRPHLETDGGPVHLRLREPAEFPSDESAFITQDRRRRRRRRAWILLLTAGLALGAGFGWNYADPAGWAGLVARLEDAWAKLTGGDPVPPPNELPGEDPKRPPPPSAIAAIVPPPTNPFPQPGRAWTNSLGMVFLPLPGTGLLLAQWETRAMDFDVYRAALNLSANRLSYAQGTNHPVAGVSWTDAQGFCRWLTDTEVQTNLMTGTQAYRLPTKLEWCLALDPPAQPPSTRIFPWGDDWPPPRNAGNLADLDLWRATGLRYIPDLRDGYAYTAPVGSFPANPLGFFDLIGNLREWVDGPAGAGQHQTVGGAWDSCTREELRLNNPVELPDESRRENLGFRCVLDLGPVRGAAAR